MSSSVRTQFQSLLEPQLKESLAEVTIPIQLFRYATGAAGPTVDTSITSLGPYPAWFTLYEVMLDLWNRKGRDPKFAPNLVFFGLPLYNESPAEGASPIGDEYHPMSFLWLNVERSSANVIGLQDPLRAMTGEPDSRFVDSAGGLRAVNKDDRFRITLNDAFSLDSGGGIHTYHVFLYTDIVDRIVGPRPLSERDFYGRLMPYFPTLDSSTLPSAAGYTSPELVAQAERTKASLAQTAFLTEQLVGLGGELILPRLDGVKLVRWVWSQRPAEWESPAILFFGTKATHERPYMRLFSLGNQKLTKVKVKGILPIPDVVDPELLLGWNQDKNPDTRKESTFIKLLLQPSDSEELPVYATLRVFADGTADLLVMPPKQKRLLDPYSDLQEGPVTLEAGLADLPYSAIQPKLGQADVVFKMRLPREAARLTTEDIRRRLGYFSSIFQEIPPLMDEQPLVMLRYKGVSNFYQEDRVFAFLTQLVSREIVAGGVNEEAWTSKVAAEFQISADEARKRVVAWVAGRNDYKLAVPEIKDYVLKNNPGVDIAVFAQHPIYNFHMYRVESMYDYAVIVNLLGILFSAPADRFAPARAAAAAKAPVAAAPAPVPVAAVRSPVAEGDGGEVPAEGEAQEEDAVFFPDDDDVPEFMRGMVNAGAPAAEPPAAEEEEAAFFPNDENVPEFMRGAPAAEPPAAEEEEAAFFPNDENVPEFMKAEVAAKEAAAVAVPEQAAPPPAVPPAPPAAPLTEDERKAKEAFGKPTDIKQIKLAKYYIERLKLADPSIFNYQKKGEKGYVTHCAANEHRHPVVLDDDEYREMHAIYDEDEDLKFVEYPRDSDPKFNPRQPSKKEDEDKKFDGAPYPSPDNPEVITLVRYGSKAKRLHWYMCPRLFCVRDRLMVRMKDFMAPLGRDGSPKPNGAREMACPFCGGKLILDTDKLDKSLDPNKTVFQRKTRPSSETERQIYIGFLKESRKTSEGFWLPCCYTEGTSRFDPNDPEFVRLGLKGSAGAIGAPPPPVAPGPPPAAQAAADAFVGEGPAPPELQAQINAAAAAEALAAEPAPAAAPGKQASMMGEYIPNYYRVIFGVSTKYLVDERKIPLEIIPPKTDVDEPKSGPQIGLLPEALDTYFEQSSKSEKFSEKFMGDIMRKLKSTSRGFLRLAVDNTKSNTNRSLFSALAPFLAYSNTADQVEEFISQRILPRQFLQLNGGNLVHEFFNKCDKPPQNSMREFVGRYVGVDQLTSANIPAIERLMNSYECFKDYLEDESQRKDMRIFYQALSEPGVLMTRGLLLIILEVTVERDVVKVGQNGREGRETEVKLANVRCPAYPLSEGQQKADVGFIIHYTEIRRQVSRARGVPDIVTHHNMGWEPLFYVEPTAVVGKTQRHKPVLTFKRADEASWPPIVQRRVSEFFSRCGAVTRGPFTSQSGMDPNALITATEVMTGVRYQTYGMIRDAYNHFVGITYGIAGKQGLVAVPVADDGSIHFERRLHFDWDDYTPAAADDVLKFYVKNIRSTFGQYRGYDILRIVNAKPAEGVAAVASPRVELIKSKDTGEMLGVRLANGFVIPAGNMREPDKILEFLNDPENIRLPDGVAGPIQIVTSDVDEFEWDLNRTIAYDVDFRKKAFEDAEVEDTDAAKYPKKYLQLKHTDIKDELEDIYQHLRISFARWLGSKEAGKSLREALKAVLRRNDLPLFEKRKRLDILLEKKVVAWMEPTMEEDAKADVGFLRVDCMVPGMTQDECTGRCKWSTESNTCKIHTPANFAVNGELAIPVPRMLYLRLVDELIRYASKREEIFTQSVPRLTIRQEAERKGDQYVIVEGTPDWNSWWEMLRSDWMTPEIESKKHFDEKYMPIPVGYGPADARVLPESMRRILGAADPKTANLVWNQSLTPDMPYRFLLSVMKGEAVETESDDEGGVGTGLKSSQIKRIAQVAKATVIYLTASDTDEPIRLIGKYPGATEALMIGRLNNIPGWVSMKGTFNVKLPLMAIPDAIRKYAI